ncbi:hypothetical protein FBU59_002768 [Linderina macrospora]|uniref:Uncharacterized protein n=1 Tax=Linderina macrospora TaxID=4868 RepID=A0ACC1JA51_9FUNG|nr:hypothetical protein FBU59_002768 [Linderina macrospora]
MYIPAAKSSFMCSGRSVMLNRNNNTTTGKCEGGAPLTLLLQTPTSSAAKRAQARPSYTPPAVVRKNSGEIVRPCLRKRASSEPNLSSMQQPSKFVHFGADLERVRWFLKAQSPQSVQADASLDDDHCTSTPVGATSHSTRPATVRLTSIRRPTPSFIVFEESPVVLERVDLADNKAASAVISGTIKVHNLAYEKSVLVRYSLDEWKTTQEVSAQYLRTLAESSGSRPGVDRFTFSLPLPASAMVSLPVVVALCVRYDVGGVQYWDNNKGANYMAKVSLPVLPAIADDDADQPMVVMKRSINSSQELSAPRRLTFNETPAAPQASAAKAAYTNPSPADTRRYMARSEALFATPSQQAPVSNNSSSVDAFIQQPPMYVQQAFSPLQSGLPMYQDVAWCGGDFTSFDYATPAYYYRQPSAGVSSSSLSPVNIARMSSPVAQQLAARSGSPLATSMRTGSPINHPVFGPSGALRNSSPLTWAQGTTASALQC